MENKVGATAKSIETPPASLENERGIFRATCLISRAKSRHVKVGESAGSPQELI